MKKNKEGYWPKVYNAIVGTEMIMIVMLMKTMFG